MSYLYSSSLRLNICMHAFRNKDHVPKLRILTKSLTGNSVGSILEIFIFSTWNNMAISININMAFFFFYQMECFKWKQS